MTGISTVLSLLSGIALFLFGMSLMGDGLKKAAGNKLELILYQLTNTPIKGVLLGAAVTAIIQSSSATSVMVVGFVNSGMMKVIQAIGIIMGANVGTSITGWILCLSYIDGSSGVSQILSTTTICAVVAIAGVVIRMTAKKVIIRNVGDIMMGFAILMTGLTTMSSSMAPLKENAQFISLLTAFSNPFLGILVGIAITAVLQSASASIGILQALSVMGAITFATAFPITLGIGVGAAVPVLLSSIGSSKNGKRTAFIYLLNDLFGMIIWGIAFYSLDAVFNFAFVDTVMNPFTIAALNSVFRLATVTVLFPFIPLIERLICRIIKDDPEDLEDARDFELLEERFLAFPALAISQSRQAVNGMAIKTAKNVYRSMNLLRDYSDSKYRKILDKENLIDKYEHNLGNYLMKLTGRELTEVQQKQVSVFLHVVSDFERISDHATNVAATAQELHETEVGFSEEGIAEILVLESAVREIVQITIASFEHHDNPMAIKVEPLREYIIYLCDELKSRHVDRLSTGHCTWKQGFPFNNLLTEYERIAAHCSNIALAMLEAQTSATAMHEYEKSIRGKNNDAFQQYYNEFEEKYRLPEAIKHKKVKKDKDKDKSKSKSKE